MDCGKHCRFPRNAVFSDLSIMLLFNQLTYDIVVTRLEILALNEAFSEHYEILWHSRNLQCSTEETATSPSDMTIVSFSFERF